MKSQSHFTLNLLPFLSGVPQLKSYSRGYHDTLSFYYTEKFAPPNLNNPNVARMLNVNTFIRHLNSTDSIPGFTVTASAGFYSAISDSQPRGYLELMTVGMCYEGSVRAAREFFFR